MTEINWDKVFKWYCICAPIVLIIVLTLLLVVIPAYESYRYDTNYLVRQTALKEGKIAGTFYPNGTIVLFVNSTITLRHELTHKYFKDNNIHTNKFLEEMVAYTNQWAFWEKVNLTSLEWER